MKKSVSIILCLLLISFSMVAYAETGEPNFTEVPDFHEHHLHTDTSTYKIYSTHKTFVVLYDEDGNMYEKPEYHNDYQVVTHYDVSCTGCDYAYDYDSVGSSICPLNQL